MREPKHPHGDVESFVKLLLDHQRRVFTYILTLVPNVADAEDVMQEVSIVLWQKFPEYRPGSDFAAWAFRVAYNTVRTFRVKRFRCRVKFDDQLLATVSADVEAMREELEVGRQVLADCANELPATDRELLTARYQACTTIRSLAAAVGRPIEGMYKAMRRIHDNLYDCVQRKLASEGIHVRRSRHT
jgi:RNA polymerase sigma-70 factor, ECF subfamily